MTNSPDPVLIRSARQDVPNLRLQTLSINEIDNMSGGGSGKKFEQIVEQEDFIFLSPL